MTRTQIGTGSGSSSDLSPSASSQTRIDFVPQLRVSSEEERHIAMAKEAEQATYRRRYWQGYVKRVKRIFGTISHEEYAGVKARADASSRTVWAQIWTEAQAHAAGKQLLSSAEMALQQELIIELRRIGNNINQLAKLGHIEARKHGEIVPRDNDRLGQETVRQFEKLERLIRGIAGGVVSQDRRHP